MVSSCRLVNGLATLQLLLKVQKEKVKTMHPLTIIGLGAGDLDQLSLGTYRKLKEANFIVARTDQHPAVAELRAEGIAISSFDEIYEKHDSFQHVYEEIVEKLAVYVCRATSYICGSGTSTCGRTDSAIIS